MNRPWAALGLVLALCGIMPRDASAQGSKPKSAKPQIKQNYPNPFNPSTWIPFTVGGGDGADCAEPNRRYTVTVKVLNSFTQTIAYPVMYGSKNGVAGNTPLKSISLSCGTYTGFWDHKTLNGKEAASGIVFIVFEQDGVAVSVKGIVGK